jgi:hypothetical protein
MAPEGWEHSHPSKKYRLEEKIVCSACKRSFWRKGDFTSHQCKIALAPTFDDRMTMFSQGAVAQVTATEIQIRVAAGAGAGADPTTRFCSSDLSQRNCRVTVVYLMSQ